MLFIPIFTKCQILGYSKYIVNGIIFIVTLPLLMTRISICTCRPGGGVYSVDTLLTHTAFDCFAFFSIIYTEAGRAPIFFSIVIEII